MALLSRSAALRLAAPLARRGLVTATKPKPIKRFWNEATVEPAGEHWRVALDGKPVKSPRGSFLELPSAAMALAVAKEWRNQGEYVRPQEMPLTTIGCTSIDVIGPATSDCVDRLLPYLACDTLCFKDEHQPLAERQAAEWGPMRAWFQDHFGVGLAVSPSIGLPEHPEETIRIVQDHLLGRDKWELTALEIATSSAKSLIVGVALLDRPDLLPDEALRIALLEEHFQIESWGLVEGEHDVSHEETLMWLAACRRFSRLHRHLHHE